MIQYWFEKHRELQARRADEGFGGFTLIELLIVIVVLGILAAVVIFALGGVTGQSKVAACNSDAKSVETAVEAYHAFPGNTDNSYPATMGDLITPTFTTEKFLRSLPSATLKDDGWKITLGAKGEVDVTTNKTAATNYDGGTNLCNTLT